MGKAAILYLDRGQSSSIRQNSTSQNVDPWMCNMGSFSSSFKFLPCFSAEKLLPIFESLANPCRLCHNTHDFKERKKFQDFLSSLNFCKACKLSKRIWIMSTASELKKSFQNSLELMPHVVENRVHRWRVAGNRLLILRKNMFSFNRHYFFLSTIYIIIF